MLQEQLLQPDTPLFLVGANVFVCSSVASTSTHCSHQKNYQPSDFVVSTGKRTPDLLLGKSGTSFLSASKFNKNKNSIMCLFTFPLFSHLL